MYVGKWCDEQSIYCYDNHDLCLSKWSALQCHAYAVVRWANSCGEWVNWSGWHTGENEITCRPHWGVEFAQMSYLVISTELVIIIGGIGKASSHAPVTYHGSSTLLWNTSKHLSEVTDAIFHKVHRRVQAKWSSPLLWSPYGIGQTIIFWSCRLFFFFPSSDLSHCRVDICHTCTHGVALVRI